jgi:hypothetical protein
VQKGISGHAEQALINSFTVLSLLQHTHISHNAVSSGNAQGHGAG